MTKFKNLTLGTKISIGFGLLILILLFTTVLGYFGMSRISEDFTRYRQIAQSDVLAGKIQANLLENQMNFKDFIVTGDSSTQKNFEKKFKEMEGLIKETKNNIVDTERDRKISSILDYAKEYKQGFGKVAYYQNERNRIVLDILTLQGNEIEKNLSELMELLLERKNEEMLYNVGQVQRHFLLARLNVVKYLEDNDEKFSKAAVEEFSQMNRWLNHLDEELEDERERELFHLIVKGKNTYIVNFQDVISLIKSRNEMIDKVNNIGYKISDTAEEIKVSIIKEKDTFEPKVKQTNNNILIFIATLSIIDVILSILISIVIVRAIVVPVKTVTNTFQGISEGEADLNVRLKANSLDEIGQMANYFNKFMEKLQVIMGENEKQNWLKTGQSELNKRIRGEQDINSLAYNIITYVCKYLNAHVGAFYLKGNDNTFKMISSYAYKKRKNLSNEIESGEGLIGQCSLEKHIIVLSNVPKDYITISSGLGEAVPNNILVAPCLYHEKDVKCILELGSFEEFTDTQIEFIETIGETIAISINSAQIRTKVKELLDKSLKQTEELQLQQEELTQTNEELKQQTRALKKSELCLQQQQEELRATNEELEEQTRNLKSQRDEINHKNEELERAKKVIEEKAIDLEVANKYKSEFLANMSHELRTPLNSILILSKLLSNKEENTAVTEKDLEFANTIYSSGSDLLNLIDDILDLSKVEAGKMEINLEDMNLKELVCDIERSFEQMILEKGLSFTIDILETLPKNIYTDTRKVKQIINNLISNAFKFTKEGGIKLSITRPSQEDVIGTDIDHKKAIKISVSDTGIGIPQDRQEIIFEAFKQSDGGISRQYGGTGLGLSICKEFTQLLGGRITLESEENKGSTFAVILPKRSAKEGEIENKDEPKDYEEIDLGQIVEKEIAAAEIKDIELINGEIEADEEYLLIIEDDFQFSQILTELATEKGFKSLSAKNGEIGIELAKRYRLRAIILDIGLPGIDGWEVIKRLKADARTKDIPIHVISGDDNADGIKKGIVGYIKKPVSLDKINEVFRNIEGVNGKTFKNILLVEDNKDQSLSIAELIESTGALATTVTTGEMAYSLLKNKSFDCMILDFGLKDMSGFNFLKILQKENLLQIPVIIYTDKELSREEEEKLQKYVQTIIVKGPRANERLMSEVSLFLHSVASKMPVKPDKVTTDYDKDTILEEKKILIIDDDMRNVFALTSLLEEKGMKVIVGKNGREGIERLNENLDTDLILMDIMMPEMDGYTAMKEIKKMKEYSHIPIIALTAKAMKGDRNKCIEAGARDYLTKPVETDKLISLLKVWLYK